MEKQINARNQNDGINKIEEWKSKSMQEIKMMESIKLKNGKANQCKKCTVSTITCAIN